MRYKLLGRSGLRVSEICLGTMTFGTEYHWGSTKEESQKVFQRYVESGGNFFDTANHYTKGTSEKMLGEFIGSDRDKFVIATKYTLSENPKDPNAGGNHRKNMQQALHASLKRLNTDYVDLYWIHAWDFMTPVDELMRALDDMVRAGKILYVGISNTPAWVISQANTLADLKGWTPFAALQLQYSLIERNIEMEFIPMAKSLDLAITAWSPLGMGVLTGKYLQGSSSSNRFTINPGMGKSFVNEHSRKIAEVVSSVAERIGRKPAQVALKWLLQQKGIVIPIVGASTVSQLEENLGCLDFTLSEDHMKELSEASAISYVYPYNFLEQEDIKRMVHGENYALIDNHRI